jgi:hypothetical protein
VQINQPSYVAIQPDLAPGETVLWAAQPDPSVIFHKEDIVLIPFSLLWGGFAIFWEAGVAGFFANGGGTGKPWVFGLIIGAAFVIMGQYFIWGRFVLTAWEKRRTHYVVTNRRVIVVQDVRGRRMASAYIDSLSTVIKESRRNGVGSLFFAPQQPFLSRRRGLGAWDSMTLGDVPEFRDIDDVDTVYRLISDQREHSRQAARTV